MNEKNIFGDEENNKKPMSPVLKRSIILSIIGFVVIGSTVLFLNSLGAPPVNFTISEPSKQPTPPEKLCKDIAGRPHPWACRTALRSKGYNVDKYISWGGADNGLNSAVCTATEPSGLIVGFEVVFKEKCEAVSVKTSNY